jgi:hypothetical protein
MYQGISSGRLPDQMIRNCENDRYGPQHREREQQLAEVVEMARRQERARGAVRSMAASTMIVKASPVRP